MLFALFGDVLPSRCSCALQSRELWQVLGRFVGIGRVETAHVPGVGRVFLSREGGMVEGFNKTAGRIW